MFESDDTFAFIAGYTAGGFPYGITWEEMEASEKVIEYANSRFPKTEKDLELEKVITETTGASSKI